MKSPRTWFLAWLALWVASFGLAATLEPQFQARRWSRTQGDVFYVILGDSRRMFANGFYTKADAYYHSGFYPTIFDDTKAFQTAHMAEDTGAVSSKNQGDEATFMGPPRNWLDAFGRHFFPDRHTHLDEGGPTGDLSTSDNIREILPWLKLATELDPNNIQTYTVTAYWLRERMHKPGAARQVLFQGLRNNPGNSDILYELGRLYEEGDHDTNRAENVWQAAARNWRPPAADATPDEVAGDNFTCEQVDTALAEAERNAGHWAAAIRWFQAAQKVSRSPVFLQEQIEKVRQQMTAPPPAQ
jgi:tetratricopeptide (TPR) repeat protein